MLVELQAGDGHDGPGGIVARASIARGRNMSPGIQQSAFYWRDVVHGPAPRRRERGTSLHVTWHGSDDSGDVRISYSTVLRVDSGADKESVADDIIHVEERTNVQRRFLQEWIDRERAFSDKVALRARSRLAHMLVAQRRYANTLQIAWYATLILGLIRFQAKAGNGMIRMTRNVMRGIVAIPDALMTHSANVSVHLASRTGRRTLKLAFRDPAMATPQEKTGLLVLIVAGLVVGILILNTIFELVLSPYLDSYNHLLRDFVLSMLGTLALPIPGEILFIASVVAVGFTLAGVGLFLGKMIASWMLYLLGDSLFDTLNKKSGPRMKGAISWLKKNSDRWGFLALFLLNAIPLAPDALIIIFAVSGMRFRTFMWSIGLATVFKFTLLATVVFFVGPEAVKAFIEHPIATIRGG